MFVMLKKILFVQSYIIALVQKENIAFQVLSGYQKSAQQNFVNFSFFTSNVDLNRLLLKTCKREKRTAKQILGLRRENPKNTESEYGKI